MTKLHDALPELDTLAQQRWNSPAHEAALEQRLLEELASGRRAAPSRLLVAMIALVLASSALAATASVLWAREYVVTVRDQQGNVVAKPRITVAPGQTASIQFSDPETGETHMGLNVSADGQVTADQEHLNVEVEVSSVAIPAGGSDPTGGLGPEAYRHLMETGWKCLVRFLDADGMKIGCTRIRVHPERGGAARLQGPQPVTVFVNPDGTFKCEGCGKVRVEVEPVIESDWKCLVRFLDADGMEIDSTTIQVHPELGGAARLDHAPQPVTVSVNPDGTFECEGCVEVRVTVEPAE